MPETVDNWGRAIAYTWGEAQELGMTWGNVMTLPYGIHRTFLAARNAAAWMGESAAALNSQLESSDMYSLSEVDTALRGADSALGDLLNAFL